MAVGTSVSLIVVVPLTVLQETTAAEISWISTKEPLIRVSSEDLACDTDEVIASVADGMVEISWRVCWTVVSKLARSQSSSVEATKERLGLRVAISSPN